MKQTFWQRLKMADNKMAQGIIVGIGTALGAGWTQQAKKEE
jgi:hypothetical protein